MDRIKGYKTKIGVIALFILGGLVTLGVIDQETFQVLATLAGGWVGYGVYDRIGR